MPAAAKATAPCVCRAGAERRAVVGFDQDAVVAVARQRLQQRADDVLVDPLQRRPSRPPAPRATPRPGLRRGRRPGRTPRAPRPRTFPCWRSRCRGSRSPPGTSMRCQPSSTPTPRTRSTAEMIAPRGRTPRERLRSAAPSRGPTARFASPASSPPRSAAAFTGWAARIGLLASISDLSSVRPGPSAGSRRRACPGCRAGAASSSLRAEMAGRVPAPDEDVAVLHAGVELDDAAGDLLAAEFLLAAPGSAAPPSSLEMCPAVKSRMWPSGTWTRLQRMAQSFGPRWMPIAAVSSGARPV